MSVQPYFDVGFFDSAVGKALGLRAYTAQDFITKAYRLLNVIEVIGLPEPEQLHHGFDVLNEMIDDWRLQSALILTIQPNRHQLNQNQQAYTIGPGGDFDQTRPSEVTRWTAILDRNANPTIRIPHARALTLSEWHLIAIQNTTGSIPNAIYYDRGWNSAGQGRIFVYPIPDVNCVDLELWTPEPLQGFATMTQPYVFPPGYTRAIRYALAVELGADFPNSLSEPVVKIASLALATVKRGNFRPRYAEFDRAIVGARGRRYDPYTDT